MLDYNFTQLRALLIEFITLEAIVMKISDSWIPQ